MASIGTAPTHCFSYTDIYVLGSQTDGASAVLLMTEEKALAMGYKPKAYLRQVKQHAVLLIIYDSSVRCARLFMVRML